MLPINQVRNGQRRPPLCKIEPATEIVQSHFGGQARLQAAQGVRPLVFQAEGFQQSIMNRLYDLAQASPPAAQPFRPAMWTLLIRLGDDQCTIAPPPPETDPLACKALLGDIAGIRRLPHTG